MWALMSTRVELLVSHRVPLQVANREGSPDMVGTGDIKYPGWTKTSTTALWRRGNFKG